MSSPRESSNTSLRSIALTFALVSGACGGKPDMSGALGAAAVSGSFGPVGGSAGAGGGAGLASAGRGGATAGFDSTHRGGSGAGGIIDSSAGSSAGAGSGASGVSGGAARMAGTSGAADAGRAGGMSGMSGGAGSAGVNAVAGMVATGGRAGAAGASGAAGGQPSARKKFVGNITTGGKVRSDFIQFWDQLTPENEGKWGSIERTRDQMSWAALDAAYNYAKQNGIPFKQHTFVWGSQQPNWISGLSQSEQRAEVEEWIRLYCERYPDTQMIDVVNEPPPHTTPPYTAALGGAGGSGYDWIVQAFRWARQYCPKAILMLNDYNTIEYANDNSHFIDIVNRIKQAGAPIDAIGVQAHAAYNLPTATVKMYLDKLSSSTGLPVYVSEYDINLADDAQQKSVMQSQFTMFWNHDNVKGITVWGYIEGQTWLTNSGLMSSDGRQRPAMTWLMDFLEQ